MANNYIWTNHAIQRLKDRKIPRKLVNQVLTHPDKTLFRKNQVTELQKRTAGRTVAALIKNSENGEKIIISCWVNPAFPGTRDYKLHKRYLAMQKAPLMKKIWLTFLTKLGL